MMMHSLRGSEAGKAEVAPANNPPCEVKAVLSKQQLTLP